MVPLLNVCGVTKSYVVAGRDILVLKVTSFELNPGESLAIVGPSGCGKTTLLGICAGLDEPSVGSVSFNGQDVYRLSDEARAKLRLDRMGYVFQNYQLFPTLTVRENILLPLKLRGDRSNWGEGERLVHRLNVHDRSHYLPGQLSAGEQQRVAIARALVNRPRLLLCDEPTASLDAENSRTAMALFFDVVRECGAALIVATHDPEVARLCRRILDLRTGVLTENDNIA